MMDLMHFLSPNMCVVFKSSFHTFKTIDHPLSQNIKLKPLQKQKIISQYKWFEIFNLILITLQTYLLHHLATVLYHLNP